MHTSLDLNTPEAVIAAVPYLIGYHPQAPNLVILGIRDGKVTVSGNLDLEPGMAALPIPAGFVDASLADTLLLIGFGPPELTEAIVTGVAQLMELLDVDVALALIVHDGRCFGLRGETPPEGVAVPPPDTAMTDDMPVFADRDAVDALFAPARGPAYDTALAAIDTFRSTVDAISHPADHSAFVTASLELLHQVTTDPQTLDTDQTARLTVALTFGEVRDAAMAAVDDDPAGATEDIWRHLVSHAPPELRTAPAVLAAYSAWRGGAGHIAAAALRVIEDQSPQDPTAQQLRRLIDLAAHPDTVAAYRPGQALTRTSTPPPHSDSQKGR
ncbi:DUF4192 domain-containing protein [Phytomonospora endophytica]|uniref:DUF4192 domain-containing protein n=1 Tax=Phytomonospora endophytica TaxID=714109 RepID=A0A841FR57_9ACTN|nr:DUF4192 domain-containing protein [Phytomonospora endophytica]MBB6038536.1 hypothetical protein [Phytomonospora endophytica]GIG69324.1 hypothetical protein Pen01_56190 [Phytomonospora endophytica]